MLRRFYNIFRDCMMNSSNSIQHINIAELDCCQIKNNIYMYVPSYNTRYNTCLMSIPRFALPGKATLRQLKLHFMVDVTEWSRALDIRLSD